MNYTVPSTRLEMTVVDNVHFGTSADNNHSFHALTLEFPPLAHHTHAFNPHAEDHMPPPSYSPNAPEPLIKSIEGLAPQWQNWKPGQFVMIRPSSWGAENIWARPLSIARVTSRGLVLFFQSMGQGTKKMTKLSIGDKVIVWGPLGTSFLIEPDTPTLLLAGGIGVVPFCGYMDRHSNRSNLYMMFGHRHNRENYPVETIAQHIEVDSYRDNSVQDRHIFLTAVRKAIASYEREKGLVLACGPEPFLKYIWELTKEYDIRVQLSLENKMACGVGACLGCVAKTSEHWADKKKAGLPVQTCTCGPVFNAKDIEF